jgi:hypothetical protein
MVRLTSPKEIVGLSSIRPRKFTRHFSNARRSAFSFSLVQFLSWTMVACYGFVLPGLITPAWTSAVFRAWCDLVENFSHRLVCQLIGQWVSSHQWCKTCLGLSSNRARRMLSKTWSRVPSIWISWVRRQIPKCTRPYTFTSMAIVLLWGLTSVSF